MWELWKYDPAPTSTGFLLRMKKFSALIIMKRMNLWHRIFSISSACSSSRLYTRRSSDYRYRSDLYISHINWYLISNHLLYKTHKTAGAQTAAWLTCLTAMLTLTELMEPSIRTFSLSLRLMITGWRSNSLLLLQVGDTHDSFSVLQL